MKKLSTIAIATLIAAAGCRAEEPSEGSPFAAQHQAVSECGGFGPVEDYDSGGDYCAAEVLSWRYDAEAGTLDLSDERVLLNCCGDHSVEAAADGDLVVVTETDAPESGAGRCDCLCVFDFALTLEGVEAGPLALRIVRDVTDEGGPATVWEGTLDLGAGEGSVVLSDEDVGMWCGSF